MDVFTLAIWVETAVFLVISFFKDRGKTKQALKAALVDGLELKPRKAFGPVRVGVTGAAVSPPLYESMELLGREKSLSRLRQARELSASL